MKKKSTKEELNERLVSVCRIPEYLDTMDYIDLVELAIFVKENINEIEYQAVDKVARIQMAYPPEYVGGNEWRYWVRGNSDYKVLLNLFSDLKNRIEDVRNKNQNKMEAIAGVSKKKHSQGNAEEKDYSLRQVAIAYFIMGIRLTEENLPEVLEKHTTSKNPMSLLNKFNFGKMSTLTDFEGGSKRSDDNHLKDLEAAKRLIDGEKNKKALKSINQCLRAFQGNYDKRW